MSDQNDGLIGGGGSPLGPPLGGSIDADEKALKKGKGGMMAVMIAIPVLLLGAFVAYILLTGSNTQYETLRQNANNYRHEYFDGFWSCVLDGTNLTTIDSNDVLVREINRRAGSERREAWAAKVRDQCMPMLEELEPKLEVLIAPPEMEERLNALKTATAEHRTTFSGYLAYIDALDEEAYDSQAALQHTNAISRAWFDYRKAQIDLNEAIRAKLEE